MQRYTTRHVIRKGIPSTNTPTKTPMALCDYHLGKRKVNDKKYFTYDDDPDKETTYTEEVLCKDCIQQIAQLTESFTNEPNKLNP